MVNFLKKSKIELLIFIFFIFTLLFPAILFNKVLFLIIVAVYVNRKYYKIQTYSPFIIFSIFLFGYINSFFNHVDRELSLQFFLSILVLFLIFPILHYNINIDRIIKVSGLLMIIYTAISFFIVVILIDFPYSNLYYDFFRNYSSGSNGLREFVEEGTLSFHIGTVPFLYLPFILYFELFLKKKTVLNFVITISIFIIIFISASRGLILSSIIAAVSILFTKYKLKGKIIFILMMLPILVFVFSYLLNNTIIFDSDEGSNGVKIGHFKSVIEHINFFNFFLGEGLGSFYYSMGSQSMKAHTEITPLDMVRYLGFVLSITLYLVIIFPVRKLKFYFGDKKLYTILFLIYVINSFTNPTMFNSYGLLVVLWYWYKILGNKNNNSLQNNLIL